MIKLKVRKKKKIICKQARNEWRKAEIVITTIQSLLVDDRYKRLFSPTDFDLLISDESHRCIGGNSRAVFEYFIGYKLGLTATPTPQAYAFFDCQQITTDKYKPTFQYSVDESYVAGINVPPRIYRIKTEVSENGGEIKDKEKVYEVNKRTGEKVSVVQDQTKNYTKTDVDRSVV